MNGNEDKKRFSVVMFWLAERMKAQGGQQQNIDAPLQRDYYEALDDIRIERIEWAAKHIFKTETWFPMPKDIRAAAMIAPSKILAHLANNQAVIPEFTEQQRMDASKICDDIINGFDGWGNL